MSDYTESVKSNLEGLTAVSSGISSDCSDCADHFGMDCHQCFKREVERGGVFDEGNFSWSPCEICGSTFGGDRYVFHALDSENELIHMEGCVDCVMYISNGEEPENWQQGACGGFSVLV